LAVGLSVVAVLAAVRSDIAVMLVLLLRCRG
jgi:hypothetical protein